MAFDGQKFLGFQFHIGQFEASVKPLHTLTVIEGKILIKTTERLTAYHAHFNVAINKSSFNLWLNSEAKHQQI